MAYIVTAKILLDDVSDLSADKVVHGILEQFVGGDIVDFSTERVAPCNVVIDDSIANETYVAGDFTRSWVIYSKGEANDCFGDKDKEEGYWSEEYGWTVLDLATVYDSENVKLPDCAYGDAILIPRCSI